MARQGQVQNFNKPVEDAMGFSAAVTSNGMIHLAGVIAVNEEAVVTTPDDMNAQVERIYDIIEETLGKCGATLEHVVNEVVFVTDLAAFMEAGPVRAKRYEKWAFPAATAVQVAGLAIPGAMVEIQLTAQLEGDEWSPDVPPVGPPG